MKKLPRLYPFLLILSLVLLFFGKAVLGLDLIVAGDFSGSDLLDLHYPFKCALHQAFKSRFLPLWTPYLDTGYPLLAEGEAGIFYPINLLLAPLPPFLALNYSIIIAFLMTGLSTYFLARYLKLDPFSSLVSAFTFMFSAFFIARIKHLNLIAVASLLPLGFFWLLKFWENLNLKYSIYLGFTLGLQILAGHPQMTFYCLLFYLWTFFFKLIYCQKKGKPLPVGKALTGLFLTGLTTFGIGAIQILPTLELTLLSRRPGFVFEQLVMYPFHPKNLITLFSPYYFGNPASGTYRENIRQMGIFWENASYIGILPLALAIFAIFTFFKQRESLSQKKRQTILFFLISAIFSLSLMLGRFLPIFSLFIKIIPFARLFRFPTRFNLFLDFSLSLLAGYGAGLFLKNIAKSKKEARFAWPLPPDRTKILIAFLIIVDLFTFGRDYLGSIKASSWLKKPESAQVIGEDKELMRIYSVSQYSESPYQTLGWKGNLDSILAIKEAIPPDANICYQIGTISSRGWFEGALSVLRRSQFEQWLLNEVKDEFMLGKVLGMFNVKYLLTYLSTENPEHELKKEIDLGKEFGTTLKVYENKQNMKRAFFVPEAKVITDEDQILKEMASFEFYPFRTVILEKEPPFLPASFTGIMDEFKEENRIEIIKYEPLDIEIKANLENEGFLVLSDTPYPGWKALVDGQQTEILTANFLQRALALKPGEHQIHFYFDPLSFKIGAIVSGGTLAVLLLLGGWSVFKKIKNH